MAFGLPMNEAIERMKQSTKEVDEALQRTSSAQADDFGKRVKEAVKRKTAHCRALVVNKQEPEEHEPFGAKLKRAMQAWARGRRVTQPK
jgi:hypothetical protein